MKKTFRTRTYEIHTDKLKNGHKVRFAFLTDLHGLIYGNNHQELYDAVLKHDSAAVLVAGDMIVNRKTETLQAAAVLLSRLSEKIPVFYTLGNHEYKMLLNPEVRQEYLNYERLLTSAGVCFLHNERISSNFCGTDFIFHGLELPIEYYHKPNSPKLSLTELEELLGTPFMSGIHILLAHNPKYGNTYLSWGADLVLSGHYHGGILRFGENHGLTCPQYLLFPPYCCGRFQSGKSTMLVSAGLGEHTIPIRLHNPRELLVIEFCPSAHKEDSHKTGRKTANGNTGKN